MFSDSFLYTQNLEVLNLEGNNINFLGFGTFAPLKKLRILNLKNNPIFSFNAINPEEIATLIPYIVRNHNSMIIHDVIKCDYIRKQSKYVGEVYHCQVVNYDALDLYGQFTYPTFMKIHFVFGDQHPGKKNSDVESISARVMSMCLFPFQLQRFLPNLKSIEITEVGMRHVLSNSFENLTDLVSLDLSYNSICTIRPHTFDNNLKLIYVNLEENNLIKIDSKIFVNNKALQEVNMLNNFCIDSTYHVDELSELFETKCQKDAAENTTCYDIFICGIEVEKIPRIISEFNEEEKFEF